jgi:LacI family transcriptional regulator
MGQLTISDIAALACVSRSTVSRVLNSHAGVRQDVRERVLRVISQHNYEPQIAARNLAGSRTSAIGLVLAGHSGEP